MLYFSMLTIYQILKHVCNIESKFIYFLAQCLQMKLKNKIKQDKV